MEKPLPDAVVEVKHVLNDLALYLDKVGARSVSVRQDAACHADISGKIRMLARELDAYAPTETHAVGRGRTVAWLN